MVFVLYLSISIALLSAWAIQKRSRLQHWFCVGVNTPKRYGQLQVKDLLKVLTWRLEWDLTLRPYRRKAPNPVTEPPRPMSRALCTTISLLAHQEHRKYKWEGLIKHEGMKIGMNINLSLHILVLLRLTRVTAIHKTRLTECRLYTTYRNLETITTQPWLRAEVIQYKCKLIKRSRLYLLDMIAMCTFEKQGCMQVISLQYQDIWSYRMWCGGRLVSALSM